MWFGVHFSTWAMLKHIQHLLRSIPKETAEHFSPHCPCFGSENFNHLHRAVQSALFSVRLFVRFPAARPK